MEVVDAAPTTSRLLPSLQSSLDDVLRASAPGDAGVLLSGLVTGDDSGFSQAREEALYRSGTTHLTSVSGSNLALVVGMLAAIGSAALGRHRSIWQVVTIGGIWTYAIIAGAQSPSVRAAIVATAAVLAFRIGRRPDFVTLILLAAAAMVVVDPKQSGWLGFQLSVAASLALALVVPAMMGAGRTGQVWAVLAATVTAQLATLPFLLPVTGTLSLTTVLANLAVAPLVGIAMPLAATAGAVGLVHPVLGEIVAAPASLLAEATLHVIDALGGSSAAVRTGVPPREVAVIFATMAALTLCLLSASGSRLVGDCIRNAMARVAVRSPSPSQFPTAGGSVSGLALLMPATARIVTREDPAHALGTDSNHAVHEPAGQEEAHQVTNEGQRAQAVSG
jgi:competence protein ComEC